LRGEWFCAAKTGTLQRIPGWTAGLRSADRHLPDRSEAKPAWNWWTSLSFHWKQKPFPEFLLRRNRRGVRCVSKRENSGAMVRFSGPDVRLGEVIHRPFKHRSDSQSHVTFRTGRGGHWPVPRRCELVAGAPGSWEEAQNRGQGSDNMRSFPDRWPSEPSLQAAVCVHWMGQSGWRRSSTPPKGYPVPGSRRRRDAGRYKKVES
jgi:hypothetical protein